MKIDKRRSNQATIMEVAIAAGVSLATVSRVTNHPEKVKKETRDKIERIIKEKGYMPNLNAKSLASSKSKTVAVVVPELTRSSIAGLVDGIAAVANKRGYLLRLFVYKSSVERQVSLKEFWGLLMSSVVDGILYINDELSQEELDIIRDSYVPVVLTNTVCDDENIPFVSVDYRKAAYDMTNEMIKKGNKDIWLISTIKKYTMNDLKIEGYKKAMEDAGLTPVVKYVHGQPEMNEPEFDAMLKEGHPEVAIVVRDSMAVSLLNVARFNHLHIPDDMQIVGFQNTKYAELSRPSLTCLNTPIYDLGETAMDLLTTLMDITEEDGEVEVDGNLYVDYSMVWRQSTK